MAKSKYLLSILTAGIIGGLIVLIGNKYISPNKQIVIVDNSNSQIKSINSTISSPPLNFTKAATLGIKSVVHIRAEESEAMAKNRVKKRRQRNDMPFGDFFSHDFFDFGLNNQFYRIKGGGSGVIISHDGYIVTNNHVVDFADNIVVTLSDKREYKAIKIGTDPSTDLAVIKIEESNLPILNYVDSDESKLGEWVLAIGNPFDYLTSSVTAGIISAKSRQINIIKDDHALEEFIQTDAAVNPGNSGGALVDTEGRLLGITSAIATPTGSYAGYSFAIPSNLVKTIINKIIENGENINYKPTLGVTAATINKQIQKDLKLSIDYGVYIDEVETGSSAEFGGILPGDIIIEANSNQIKSFEDLRKVTNYIKVGENLILKILRNNKQRTITVKLK